MNILQAMDDPAVFGQHFRAPQSWTAWRALLAGLFGLPMTADQRIIYRQCTGRSARPSTPAHEGWLICGRRAGKSFILALIAVFLACFRDWRPHLAVGERATIMIIASDRRQARVIMRYVLGLLQSVPMLSALIESERADGIDLRNRVTLEIHTASFRSTRGYTIVAALLDELAFWPTDDAAEPDYEIIAALRPGMATIPGAMLLCASSPYAKRGTLYNAHLKHFAKDNDPILVWCAPTLTMNPTVPQSVIDQAMELDPASAIAEYGAQFRSDFEGYVSREVVLACVGDHFERPPVDKQRYFAFCDPAGGSGTDSFTLAIAHREQGDRIFVDALREVRPPFSPQGVVDDFALLLKNYRVHSVTGDRFAGEWPREQFRKRGISYKVAAKVRSDLYRDFLPVLNSNRVLLPKSDRLINQLCALERHTGASGKDRIDHRRDAHDDLSNVVAGVADLVATPRQEGVIAVASWGGDLIWSSDGRHRKHEDNVANPQSAPCTIVFPEEKPLPEGVTRRLGPIRIW